jgi:hypothetical protein
MSVIVDKTLYCIRVLVVFYPLKKIERSTIVSRLNILAWIKRYLTHLSYTINNYKFILRNQVYHLFTKHSRHSSLNNSLFLVLFLTNCS